MWSSCFAFALSRNDPNESQRRSAGSGAVESQIRIRACLQARRTGTKQEPALAAVPVLMNPGG